MSELLKPYRPGAARPFGIAEAGHLLRRAAFSGSLEERNAVAERGPEDAVDALLEGDDPEHFATMQRVITSSDEIDRVRGFRLLRMLRGPNRLQERLSYFWHLHFATSNAKVKQPRWILDQWDVFDQHGLGRFDELLLEVSRDKAMIRWLDNETNEKGSPNENYAREIFELFALGRGAYSERDIQEAARAFTGWSIRSHRFRKIDRHHDDGEKQVFGESGAFDGEDVVQLAAAHPASARFLARKWLEFFVHPEPTDDEIDALATEYTNNGRHVGRTLRTLLTSELFYSPRARRSRVKDPIDLVVGLVRSLGGSAPPQGLAESAGLMGQVLCEPPSVEGWHRERAWLNAQTWVQRQNFSARLFGAGSNPRGLTTTLESLLEAVDGPPDPIDTALLWLHDGEVGESSKARLRELRRSAGNDTESLATLFQTIQSLPEGQLL